MSDFNSQVQADIARDPWAIDPQQNTKAPQWGKETSAFLFDFAKAKEEAPNPAFVDALLAALAANYVVGGNIRHKPYIAALETFGGGPLQPTQRTLAIRWAAKYTAARVMDEIDELPESSRLLSLVEQIANTSTIGNPEYNFAS